MSKIFVLLAVALVLSAGIASSLRGGASDIADDVPKVYKVILIAGKSAVEQERILNYHAASGWELEEVSDNRLYLKHN